MGDVSRCETPQRLGSPGWEPTLELLCPFPNPRGKGWGKTGRRRSLGESLCRPAVAHSGGQAGLPGVWSAVAESEALLCTSTSTTMQGRGVGHLPALRWGKRKGGGLEVLDSQQSHPDLSSATSGSAPPRKWHHGSEKDACVFSAWVYCFDESQGRPALPNLGGL